MVRPVEKIDRDLRKRIIALARGRGDCEEMVRHFEAQISMGNQGPAEIQNLLEDEHRYEHRIIEIIREMDEIHAERVRLGLAS